jgi:hypothetical protein
MAKAGNRTGPRRFQNTTLPCYNQQLRVSSPFTGRRASPGNQPQNRKGHGVPTRVHQGKVITEKTLLQYEERLADDKTVDCLEDIAIVASAIWPLPHATKFKRSCPNWHVSYESGNSSWTKAIIGWLTIKVFRTLAAASNLSRNYASKKEINRVNLRLNGSVDLLRNSSLLQRNSLLYLQRSSSLSATIATTFASQGGRGSEVLIEVLVVLTCKWH